MVARSFLQDVVDGKYGDPIQDVDPNAAGVKTQARPDDNSIVMTVDHADGLKAAQLAEAVRTRSYRCRARRIGRPTPAGYRWSGW